MRHKRPVDSERLITRPSAEATGGAANESAATRTREARRRVVGRHHDDASRHARRSAFRSQAAHASATSGKPIARPRPQAGDRGGTDADNHLTVTDFTVPIPANISLMSSTLTSSGKFFTRTLLGTEPGPRSTCSVFPSISWPSKASTATWGGEGAAGRSARRGTVHEAPTTTTSRLSADCDEPREDDRTASG